MSQHAAGPGGPAAPPEASASVPRSRGYELLAHLVASAEICAAEPPYYGTFRLLDAASKLAAMLLDCGLDDPWLADLRAGIDQHKMLLMTDRPAYYAYLPQASRLVALRLTETAPGQAGESAP